jgi:tRNA pseudouridine55 synthase
MNGIICIDKESGMTSFDVVARMRHITGERRIGHAGTLDPMATGVLPLFLGNATKAIDLLPNQEKTYIAQITLGITTDTGDITGEILSQTKVDVTLHEFEQAVLSFKGESTQIPPMYSALKHNGQRLYDLARAGVEVDREPRHINIMNINLLGRVQGDEYIIEVHCSKGTYIRTLCEDIGKQLGCGATMSALRRTFAAGFPIEKCITLDKAAKNLENNILNVEYPFNILPAITVTDKQAVRFINGGALSLERLPNLHEGVLFRVKAADGEFLGIGRIDNIKQELEVGCLFKHPEIKL